jgi:hypothetical protein
MVLVLPIWRKSRSVIRRTRQAWIGHGAAFSVASVCVRTQPGRCSRCSQLRQFPRKWRAWGGDCRSVRRLREGPSRLPAVSSSCFEPVHTGKHEAAATGQVLPGQRIRISSIHAACNYRSECLQVLGHFAADLDPLKLDKRAPPVELDPAFFGFTDADLDREYVGPLPACAAPRTVLRAAPCTPGSSWGHGTCLASCPRAAPSALCGRSCSA